MVNSRMRRMIRSSISVSSERFTNGSTSCSRVLTGFSVLGSRLSVLGSRFSVPGSRFAVLPSWDRDLVDHIIDHRVGGETVACGMGTEPDPVAENVLRKILNVLGIHLGAAPDEQRPHFRQAAPANDRARRG